MSRNARKTTLASPVKIKVKVPAKSRDSDASSSLDLSDEGGYSGVEDISDSDEDEEDVNAVEEEHIRTDIWRHNVESSPRPDDEEQGDDEEEADVDDVDESSSWDGFHSDTDEAQPANQPLEDPFVTPPVDTPVERRVRFDVPESDGDSTETDDDIDHGFFPDIFVDQSSLDPSFRQEIEHDDDNDSNSGFWDFHGASDPTMEEAAQDLDAVIKALSDSDNTPMATPLADFDFSLGDATGLSGETEADNNSMDGYDSDGDTTDEEDPPERLPKHKGRQTLDDNASDSESVTLIKPRRGQPRVGRFNLDSSSKKPIAIVNPRTGKMMIFTPQQAINAGFELSPEQFNMQWFANEPESSPMVNSGNMMMSAMVSSNTFGDFMNTQAAGPEEAFLLPGDNLYETFDDDFFGNIFEEASETERADVDEEGNLKIDDFIDFDDFAPSSDDENQNEVDDPILGTPAGRSANGTSDVTSLLDHFENNTDIVGAFRRDQANHQLISRSKATRDSLAFSGPYFEGTLRGIKDGRIATTNVPISPLRKQRKTLDNAGSPLAGASQKRKASSSTEQWGHKRQRSIPDVNLLSI